MCSWWRTFLLVGVPNTECKRLGNLFLTRAQVLILLLKKPTFDCQVVCQVVRFCTVDVGLCQVVRFCTVDVGPCVQPESTFASSSAQAGYVFPLRALVLFQQGCSLYVPLRKQGMRLEASVAVFLFPPA